MLAWRFLKAKWPEFKEKGAHVTFETKFAEILVGKLVLSHTATVELNSFDNVIVLVICRWYDEKELKLSPNTLSNQSFIKKKNSYYK